MILLAAPAVAAAVYYLIALIAAWTWGRRFRLPEAEPASRPPISILKPVHGRDPHFFEALCSHAIQDYPEYEILFGCAHAGDPALDDVYRLAADYPHLDVRVILSSRQTPNAKAGVLADLAEHARHPILLVNDSDISVEPDYLRKTAAPLEDPAAGLVTCLYRATGDSWPARCEAIGIATEFAPSVLVARTIGVAEFALGSTMLFRAGHLREIGGFEALGDFLADDYQVGQRISDLGYRIALADTIVETRLGAESWGAAWRHQVRWARTIRVSRPAGYCGYVVTHATLWAIVAACAGFWKTAAATLLVRMAAGIVTAARVLRDRQTVRYSFLIPLRDLWGFAVWTAGLAGRRVEWRGSRLHLAPDGRILRSEIHDYRQHNLLRRALRRLRRARSRRLAP